MQGDVREVSSALKLTSCRRKSELGLLADAVRVWLAEKTRDNINDQFVRELTLGVTEND